MSAIELIYAALMTYFVTLNGGYLVLTAISTRVNLRRSVESGYTQYEVLASSRATVPVSVIIPAYNEQVSVIAAVETALASEHPEFEVILVNDGSTDDTMAIAIERFELEVRDVFHPRPLETKPVRRVYQSRRHPNLWAIDKENGSQADAYNAGVNLARYRYIVQVDSDCVLDREALLRTMRVVNHDPGRIVGIGGQVRPGNGMRLEDGRMVPTGERKPLVVRFQEIEYLGVFLAQRPAWSELNAVPVVAGGYGAWRKDLLIELGGYSTELTHPDIEITQAAHDRLRTEGTPYRVAFAPDAVSYTEVPSSWRDLMRQRKRWQRVVIETVWKYRRMLFSPRHGSAGMLGMPYLLLYEALGPVFEVAAYALTAWLAATGALSVTGMLAFLVVSFGLSMVVRLTGVYADVWHLHRYERGELVKRLALCVLEPITRPVLLPSRLWALAEFVRGQKSWEAMTRIGTPTIETAPTQVAPAGPGLKGSRPAWAPSTDALSVRSRSIRAGAQRTLPGRSARDSSERAGR